MMRANEQRRAARGGRVSNTGGGHPRVFAVATRWTTYARIFYLFLSLPIALASWVAFVVLISVGGGLAVTVVGIPLLVLTMYLWCFDADLERLLSNTLLGTNIRPCRSDGSES
jgi:hypothetical protein